MDITSVAIFIHCLIIRTNKFVIISAQSLKRLSPQHHCALTYNQSFSYSTVTIYFLQTTCGARYWCMAFHCEVSELVHRILAAYWNHLFYRVFLLRQKQQWCCRHTFYSPVGHLIDGIWTCKCQSLWMNCVCDGLKSYRVSVFLFLGVCSRSMKFWSCAMVPLFPAISCHWGWSWSWYINPYPTAFPYGNGMVLHFYQQQESSTTKTVHRVINKGLKTYV